MSAKDPVRELAVRIAMKHINLNPPESLIVALMKDIQRTVSELSGNGHYFILRDVENFDTRFWNGKKWGDNKDRQLYYVFDEAILAHSKARLSCSDNVLIAHQTPTGVVKYKPV